MRLATGVNVMVNPIADPLVENVDSDVQSDKVLFEAVAEGAVTITINAPAKKNAFDDEIVRALSQAFETAHGAEGVRVVFLTGAGGAFSAGADVEWMRDAIERTEEDNREDAMELAVMLKRLHDIPALTVALVEGFALGGGAGLVAACDMAIACADARFGFTEVRLGLIAATISPYVVAALGPRRARRYFSTGEVFDAETARHVGLVDEIVADAASLAAAKARLIAQMSHCSPRAIEESKRLVEEVVHRRIDHGLMSHTAHRIAAQRVSEEGQAGVRAFLDGRPPPWSES
jgi:methylglutaconyl-CoA hydratase